MDYRAYVDMAPDYGLDSQQIRTLSEKGRARIAAENATKEVKRKEKQEQHMRYKGWKGTMEQGLELLRGMASSVGAGMGKCEREKRQGAERRGYEKME